MANTQATWIIDDDRSIRWVFEKALARENLEFKSFSSAKEALDELEHSTPQVVVSDIRMPGGSGLDLLQNIKQIPDPPRHHHDRVFRFGFGRGRLPRRCL